MAHVLAKDLRDAVLQAAIQGKLTKQNQSDYSANTDYKRIKESHSPIKPCKSEIDYTSMDLNLPENWVMAELNELFDFVDYRGKTPHKINEGVFLITASNVRKGFMDYTRKEYISEQEYQDRQSRGITEYGDLLFTTEAPMGMAALCDLKKVSCGQRVITLKEYIKGSLIPKLFMLFILSPSFQQQLQDNCTGTTAKGIKGDKLKHFLIPLPPLEEQQRIVDRVDELMARINEYEKLENQLVQLKEQFPKDMRDSLLQAAIQGKLTKQLKNDTSVEEILKSIEEQKKTLIKEDKLQKKKSFHLIRNDEIPFDIPDNWVFAKLGYISTYDEAKQKINARDANDNLWMLDLEDIAKGGTLLCKKRVFERNAIGDKTIFEKGSILYSKLRPYLLKILIADEDGICTPELVPFKMYGGINTSYIALFLKSPYVDSEINKVTYGVKMPRVGTKTMVNFYVPLPPIEEQQRIVDKLDEMLPLVDALAQMD